MERNLVPRSFFRLPAFLPTLWEEMEERMSQWIGNESNTGITVSEDDNNVYVNAHLPGLKPNEIDISLNQNTLWIKGEKEEKEENKDQKVYRNARSSFFYQVVLPSQIEDEPTQTKLEDGVLTLIFKKTQQNQVRKITIKNGNSKQIKNNGNSNLSKK